MLKKELMEAIIINNVSEFEGLKNEWENLFIKSRCQNIFLSYDWHFTWWKYFCGKNDLVIVRVVENGETIAIAPLYVGKKFGFNCLSFIGSAVSDFEDFLFLEGSRVNQIVMSIFSVLESYKRWDILRVKKIKKSSNLYSCLKEFVQNNDFSSCLTKHKEGAPYLENPGNWESFAKQLKTKFLSDSKRRRRKLSDMGEVSFSGNIEDAKEIKETMDKLRELHKTRRNSKGEKSFLEDAACFEFFCDFARKMHEKNVLHLSSLRLNEKVVAVNFGTTLEASYGYQIPVFDQEYKPYAVSRLLLMELVKECFDLGIKKFDFMLGDESYKNDWNPIIEDLYFFTCAQKTKRGIVAKFLFSDFNMFIKRILKKAW